jgi:glucokinase
MPGPSAPLSSRTVLAVDIGGTKMAAALVDADGGVHHRHQGATDRGGTADALFAGAVTVVEAVLAAAGEAGRPQWCGVGCGGPMDLDAGTVSPLNIGGWRDFPLRARLEELTGLPVTLDNDAKALTLGEGWRGAAAGRRNFAGMVVSTGVGGGLVVDGRLVEGASGNAGHIGHVVVEPDGRPCACGGRGCLEAEASGLSIEQVTGAPPEAAGLAVVERTGRLVGRAVASTVSLLDLRLVVVAGSVALGFGAPFFDAAQRELTARAALEYATGATIVPAGLGSDAPIVGAAALALRAHGVDIGIA